MKLYYTDQFVLPLPSSHRFPMAKYRRLRERLVDEGVLAGHELIVPPAADNDELARAHDWEYIRRVTQGELSPDEIKRLGFPWSPELVERSRRSSGATIAACRAALVDGFSANLAGGTHHAFRDRAEGYCLFNDSVVAARAMQAEGLIQRALFIDCDVHQGNGTAAIVRDDPSLYAFSIHSERNYPFPKEMGDLDIGLPDGTSDDEYLAALDRGLSQAFWESQPDLAIYLAGADPYGGDRLGRLALTQDGLRRRDEMVFAACRKRNVPVATTMAGGYCPDIDAIVTIHATTIALGLAMFKRNRGG